MDKDKMRQAIIDLPEQLSADLPFEEEDVWIPGNEFLLSGMGGSALAADLLKVFDPNVDLLVHRDYDLPKEPFIEGRSMIFSSYSGNTEEPLSGLALARQMGHPSAAITAGGSLLEMAHQAALPVIVLPLGLPPRLAVGYSFLAIARLCLGVKKVKEIKANMPEIEAGVKNLEEVGKKLADSISDRPVIVYASTSNQPLAYYWKITFNETGKRAAFWNVLPEQNHNELESPSSDTHYLLLRDASDKPQIAKRFDIIVKQYEGLGLRVDSVELPNGSPLERIFYAVSLANWVAYHVAARSGKDPASVPIIEGFKKSLRNEN